MMRGRLQMLFGQINTWTRLVSQIGCLCPEQRDAATRLYERHFIALVFDYLFSFNEIRTMTLSGNERQTKNVLFDS